MQGTDGGSPSKPGKQKHFTWPLITLQPELVPQGLSWHLSPSGTKVYFRDDIIERKLFKWCLWSQFKSQNLLHCSNGFPVSPFGQKQIGLPLSFSHAALTPHGFGMHGLTDSAWQIIWGFPSKLGGHLHFASWFSG